MTSDPTTAPEAAAGSAGPASTLSEAQPAAPSPATSTTEARLAEALAEAERLRNEWLRAKAETENVRRRAVEDVSKAHKFGVESFASTLLGVKDSLEAALALESPTIESLRPGVELTSRQLEAAFEKFAVREVAPAPGDRFDPHRHQAISQVPSDQAPNTVALVLQKGWTLHDRVLRPALVAVAVPRPAEPSVENAPS